MDIGIINQHITDYIQDKDIFLVESKITPGKVLVSVDKTSGITIDECAALSRHLYQSLESTGIFEKYELEVGSPGMDQPLKVFKQYLKRIGKNVKVITTEGQHYKGVLQNATEERIEIVQPPKGAKKGKEKPEPVHTVIPMEQIKETKLDLNFK